MEQLNEIWNNFSSDLIEILPKSPFKSLIEAWSIDMPEALSWLNWLMPIKEMVTVLEAWLACYVIYLLAQIVMRWIKVIE